MRGVISQDDPDEPTSLRLGLSCKSDYESPFKTAPPNVFWLDKKFLTKFPRKCFYVVIEGGKYEEGQEEEEEGKAVAFDVGKRTAVNGSFIRIDCAHSNHIKAGVKKKILKESRASTNVQLLVLKMS